MYCIPKILSDLSSLSMRISKRIMCIISKSHRKCNLRVLNFVPSILLIYYHLLEFIHFEESVAWNFLGSHLMHQNQHQHFTEWLKHISQVGEPIWHIIVNQPWGCLFGYRVLYPNILVLSVWLAYFQSVLYNHPNYNVLM